MTSLLRRGWQLANDPCQSQWVAAALWLVDAVLCAGIILKIPCMITKHDWRSLLTATDTEIDWEAYMQQIAIYKSGERDYAKIYGGTGPLVYPGGHVYIYRALYELTDEGRNIFVAQCLFTVLYLGTLIMVMRVYREAGVPPIIFPLLILSKRLHSIFLLRLFNDGFAVLFLFVAIYFYQKRNWAFGSIVWSIGLSVKMSLLLALPAVAVIIWHAVGRDRSLKQIALMLQVQVMAGYEFLGVDFRSYLTRAFELSRQFLFKWTVNWRFVGEETFLSNTFSTGLLIAHAVLLFAIFATRWIRPAGISIFGLENVLLAPPSPQQQEQVAKRLTPDFVTFTMLSSMIIGCLCARSLHYQFYAYIAWSTPFLLWRSGIHPVFVYAIWAAQEWAWNRYPSTEGSSYVVVECLALTLFTSWVGTHSAWLVTPGKQED